MSDVDDVELVRLALNGDPAARRELARRLMRAVAREVSFAIAQAARAEARDPRQEVGDLVQQILLGLFEEDGKQLRRWDPARGRGLESFVQLIARRRAPRMLSGGRGNPWADAPIDHSEVETADDADLTARIEQRSQLDSVLATLYAKMNARDHELFDLLFVRELPPERVAQQLEMTRGAVNAWAYRVRRTARAIALTAEQGAAAQGDATHG